jgi:hypothetical protein
MLQEKLWRRHYLQPILETGESIDWDVGVRCFRVLGGRSSPIQEGFIALTDRRILFVPKDGYPVVWVPDDIRDAQIVSKRKRTARVKLTMQSGELWTVLTGRESAGYITNLANGTPMSPAN